MTKLMGVKSEKLRRLLLNTRSSRVNDFSKTKVEIDITRNNDEVKLRENSVD